MGFGYRNLPTHSRISSPEKSSAIGGVEREFLKRDGCPLNSYHKRTSSGFDTQKLSDFVSFEAAYELTESVARPFMGPLLINIATLVPIRKAANH
jgi:hypothetical protein